MNWLASLAARIAVLGPAAIRGGATYLRQITIRSSDKFDDGAMAGGAGLVSCAYRFGATAVWRLVKGSAPALYIYADALPLPLPPPHICASRLPDTVLTTPSHPSQLHDYSASHAHSYSHFAMAASKRDFGCAFDIPVGSPGDNVAAEPQVCPSQSLLV